MKKIWGMLFGFIVVSQVALAGNQNCYQGSNYYGAFTWLYLKSVPTDGDLEAGTFLTLTDEPANLHAVVQQVEPDRCSAYRINLGYFVPRTPYDLNVSYFHYAPKGSFEIGDININQFFQNFLGGSYTSIKSFARERINQFDLTAGQNILINSCLRFHPYLGLTYADINRKMQVKFTDLIFTQEPSDLKGTVESDYCGVGPLIGADFAFSFFRCFQLEGRFGGGVLFGNIASKINSKATEGASAKTFKAKDSYCRAMTLINTRLGLVFQPQYQICNFGLKLELGYEADYYFKAVDRINPFNGYVINTETFPVKTSSNLGVGGPFVMLTISNEVLRSCLQVTEFRNPCFEAIFNKIYAQFTSSWLKPISNNGDLVYATLDKEDGSMKNQKAHFDYSWNGMYMLGFESCDNLNLRVAYFHLNDEAKTSIKAEGNEEIFSIDSSGPTFVAFSEAASKASYDLDQVDCLVGKYLSPFCQTQILLSFGLRYADLKRTMNNQYEGGDPPLITESKFATLRSHYYGVGPIFTFEPFYSFCSNFRLEAKASLALLAGRLKSTLDQVNQGDLESSNTLRVPFTRYLVPVLDVEAGLNYSYCLSCGVNLTLETGYQFSEYFRAINLVFPTFLTGLEQINSDLKLHGPYLTLNVGF